jgi:hypothetical protein
VKLKEQKHREAIARQNAANKLTASQRLERLDIGGFTATKERRKLNAEILAEKNKTKASR